MAFELGQSTISPGDGTAFWWYTLDGGTDHGAECAMANPRTPNVRLDANNQGKKLEFNGGITYFVDVTYRDGVDACTYDLQGGGYV